VITLYHKHPKIAEALDFEDPAGFFTQTENAWIAQTHFILKDLKQDLRLADDTTHDGILIGCSCSVHEDFQPRPSQFFVSVNADGPPHRWADMYIVQNATQARWLPNAVFIPHWPQPGLIVRNPTRGDAFEKAIYFGDPPNLAPELRSEEWSRRLARAGFDWEMRGPGAPNNADFSDVDVVIAARSFHKSGFIRKPASKLVNAWLAGTPAICGREVAMRETGAAGTGYLEARSSQETFDHLIRLREDVAFRRKIVDNGKQLSRRYNRDFVISAWMDLFVRAAKAQQAKAARGRSGMLMKRARRKAIGVNHRIWEAIGQSQNAF
jgi:hypothetical protein